MNDELPEIRLPIKKLRRSADWRIRWKLWVRALSHETFPALLTPLRSPALLIAVLLICMVPLGTMGAQQYVYSSPQVVKVDTLYKWKRSMEVAELKKKKNPVNRANYYLILSERRLQEGRVLSNKAKPAVALVPTVHAVNVQRKEVPLSVGSSRVGGLLVESAQFMSLSLREAFKISAKTEQANVFLNAQKVIDQNIILAALLTTEPGEAADFSVSNSFLNVFQVHHDVITKKVLPPTPKAFVAASSPASAPAPIALDDAVTFGQESIELPDSIPVPYERTLADESYYIDHEDEDDDEEWIELPWFALPDDEREEHLWYYEQIEEYEDDEWEYDEDEYEAIELYEDFVEYQYTQFDESDLEDTPPFLRDLYEEHRELLEHDAPEHSLGGCESEDCEEWEYDVFDEEFIDEIPPHFEEWIEEAEEGWYDSPEYEESQWEHDLYEHYPEEEYLYDDPYYQESLYESDWEDDWCDTEDCYDEYVEEDFYGDDPWEEWEHEQEW